MVIPTIYMWWSHGMITVSLLVAVTFDKCKFISHSNDVFSVFDRCEMCCGCWHHIRCAMCLIQVIQYRVRNELWRGWSSSTHWTSSNRSNWWVNWWGFGDWNHVKSYTINTKSIFTCPCYSNGTHPFVEIYIQYNERKNGSPHTHKKHQYEWNKNIYSTYSTNKYKILLRLSFKK